MSSIAGMTCPMNEVFGASFGRAAPERAIAAAERILGWTEGHEDALSTFSTDLDMPPGSASLALRQLAGDLYFDAMYEFAARERHVAAMDALGRANSLAGHRCVYEELQAAGAPPTSTEAPPGGSSAEARIEFALHLRALHRERDAFEYFVDRRAGGPSLSRRPGRVRDPHPRPSAEDRAFASLPWRRGKIESPPHRCKGLTRRGARACIFLARAVPSSQRTYWWRRPGTTMRRSTWTLDIPRRARRSSSCAYDVSPFGTRTPTRRRGSTVGWGH